MYIQELKLVQYELYGIYSNMDVLYIYICTSLFKKIKLDKKIFLKLNTWPNIGCFYFYFFFVKFKIKRPEKKCNSLYSRSSVYPVEKLDPNDLEYNYFCKRTGRGRGRCIVTRKMKVCTLSTSKSRTILVLQS